MWTELSRTSGFFQDFPVLENAKNKIPGSVQTLLLSKVTDV